MNPLDFLDVAGELAAGLREAEWRSALSRAYYATFHMARRLLQQGGFEVPQTEKAHGYLWLRLSNAGHPDVCQAGLDLGNLRTVRNVADYDVDDDLVQDMFTLLVQELPKFEYDQDKSFRAWLWTIMRRKWLDHQRHRQAARAFQHTGVRQGIGYGCGVSFTPLPDFLQAR